MHPLAPQILKDLVALEIKVAIEKRQLRLVLPVGDLLHSVLQAAQGCPEGREPSWLLVSSSELGCFLGLLHLRRTLGRRCLALAIGLQIHAHCLGRLFHHSAVQCLHQGLDQLRLAMSPVLTPKKARPSSMTSGREPPGASCSPPMRPSAEHS